MKIIIEIPSELTSDIQNAFDKAYQGRVTQDFKSAKPKIIEIAKDDWVKIKVADFVKGVLKSYQSEEAVNKAKEKINEQVESAEIKVDIK